MIATYTDIQYKQKTKLTDDTNVYEVLSSLDLFWLYKTEEYRGKYWTTLKITGTIKQG